jgi:hypothetical protein
MDDNFYSQLVNDLGTLKESDDETLVSGMDDFLTGKNRVKIASIDDFFNFLRISSDTLVHKAERDLWKISEDEKGQVVIERLFDPNTKNPLRI